MTFTPNATNGSKPNMHESLLELAMNFPFSDRDARRAAIITACENALAADIADTALFERTLALATGYMPYWRQGGFVSVLEGRVCACGPRHGEVEYYKTTREAITQVDLWVERSLYWS